MMIFNHYQLTKKEMMYPSLDYTTHNIRRENTARTLGPFHCSRMRNWCI